ncbi:hypothetical protein DH2020_019270 [Rehmannia glutinosa]|uniref:Bacterial Ig-like domain-containing protein n=1 Tax=Rehmannia glutinosa TaxID=99300 RepID=A0ABR0WLC4_REHGL
MGLKLSSFLLLQCWVFLILSLRVQCDGSEVALKLLKTPHAFSNRNSAIFAFQVLLGGNGSNICSHCSTNCKLDRGKFSACEGGNISYARLLDGNHSFEVCTNGSTGVACASYNWTVDTVNPTAHITAETSFTNASQVSVNISFSEICGGGGGFRCSSVNACNLLVYGPGEVMPSTLNVIQPNLKYSLIVRVSERVRYGRLILVMDKNFCTDSAGNGFTRTANSSLFIHFDRRSVHVDLRTHIPERLLQINSETRTILATNKNKNLKIYLYFTEPVVNSSAEILSSLNTNQGSLVSINGSSFGQRRFGYELTNISELAIVTLSLQSNLVISRQGTPVSPVLPVSFLYDSQRPTVRLSTTCNMRTKEKSILILIKFMKPVFGFNSSHVSISGGHLQSFQEMSRSSYTVHIQAETDAISVSIPENITTDVSGNPNRASNTLQVRHYSVPVESFVLSSFATAAFAVTALIAGFLTVSTTSLLSAGAFSRPNSILRSDPARNLFRIASHIQVFALTRWLAVTLPVEYYELAKGLQWSIPYFNLPWEKGSTRSVMVGSTSPKDRLFRVSEIHDSIFFEDLQPQAANTDSASKVFGLPLTPIEYRSYFEYKEVHQEGQKFHWYQEIIRVTLGPGKRGQWTWKSKPYSIYLTIFGPLFEDLRGPPKYMLSQISGSSLNKPGDRIIASDDETEDAEAPFIQKLFGILRIYYTLIECAKRVALGIVAGAYSGNWSSRTPTITLLSITSFQLFFMVLKKPFIKKKVQLVEIICVSCEVAIFAFCAVLSDREFSTGDERKIGIAMLSVFLLAFLVQMMNEWFALYRQIKLLDPITNSFLHGLKTALIGFVLFSCPHGLIKNLKSRFPINNPGETDTNSGDRNRSSGSRSSGEKPWMRQIRELARSSFSKEGSKATQSDPSTSKSRWSGFWKSKRSGSSSASTSTDFKSKPRGLLYKELEDIFASK